MTQFLDRLQRLVDPRYRIERQVTASAFRSLYLATDHRLNRKVSFRVSESEPAALRDWFLREAEALAQLDHPAIRHLYDVGEGGGLVWRIGNWLDGEGLDQAVAREPRPIPHIHVMTRALLGAMENAHTLGILIRRVLPSSLIVGPLGRGTLTDLRYSSYVLPWIPPEESVAGEAFMAPEVRDGAAGDPAADVYTAAAVIYFALTGREPPLSVEELILPTTIRPNVPQVFDRILQRALQPNPGARYITAWEMYQDFVSEAGDVASHATLISPARPEAGEDLPAVWEKQLRRALGDDYELLGELGRGGFGRVYRVRDLNLERVVALKMLDPQMTLDPGVVERFRREAQLAARLQHPHVVDIYDIGGRYGLVWYTMELVEGPNLAQLVERDGPLSEARVLRLLRESLSALADAHRLGLVHRDIKPENLLMEPDGSLQITDFGLAIALRGEGHFGGATSRSGTPQFAAPEQLLGGQVDQRSDLYSLAVVATYALLGRPPFDGKSVEQILARQTTNVRPDLRAERSDLGPVLPAVLDRALSPAPEDRYASAAEFLQALAFEAQPLPYADEESWGRAASRFFRRGRTPRDRGTA